MLEQRVRDLLSAGNGDEAATLVIETHGPAVLGYLCNVLDEDDARDVFSMFAENVWKGLPGFRGDATLRAWAFRVAWRAVGRHRRDPWRRRGERLPSTAASLLAESVLHRSSLLPGGRRERLSRLRSALDEEERTLLVLRIDKELEWEEIAAVLQTEGTPVTPAALRKRFERLKEKLARLAREQGLVD